MKKRFGLIAASPIFRHSEIFINQIKQHKKQEDYGYYSFDNTRFQGENIRL